MYSYSSGMVVSSFTRMVSEAQCCGRLHHRDSHSFPLLLSGAIAKVTCLLRPGMLGIHILYLKEMVTELCLVTIVVDSVGPIEICEFTVPTKPIVGSVKYEYILDTERHHLSSCVQYVRGQLLEHGQNLFSISVEKK